MEFIIQPLIGLFLTLAACSGTSTTPNSQIRELQFSSNVSEINNRDLNKIVKANPKTETSDSKFELFPLKLSENNVQENSNITKTRTKENSLESNNSKPSDLKASDFWRADFHSENFVFSSKTTPNDSLQVGFDSNIPLTTPTSKLFDENFKQTAESVAQLWQHDFSARKDDRYDFYSDNNRPNTSFEFKKTEMIINNETVGKNSIRRNVKIEQTQRINFENIYNETKVYNDEDGVGANQMNLNITTSTPAITTERDIKENVLEKSTPGHLLSNNIDIEFTSAIPLTTTIKIKERVNEAKIITTPASTSKLIDTTTISKLTKQYSDEENIIPLQLNDVKPSLSETTTEIKEDEPTSKHESLHKRLTEEEFIDTTTAIATTLTTATEELTTTISTLLETTTLLESGILSDSTDYSEDGTTTFIVDNATEILDATTTVTEPFSTTIITNIINEKPTSEGALRTSKSLENFTTEDTSTKKELKELEISPITKIDLEMTTKSNYIEKLHTSTKKEEINVTDTTDRNREAAAHKIVVPSKALNNATVSTETSIVKSSMSMSTREKSTTTEFSFVPIRNSVDEQTTILPEILDPHLNYSTFRLPDETENTIRKAIDSGNEKNENLNINGTTESNSETIPPEHGFTKEGEEGGKGKIAAIVISCVGAVCLILLAGLLYVMKRRQKRLNYGPRCRPVSLDDYSIDNLSVYNSVRRKGAPRLSKRSFGNPAFDDPVAPSHPLNFPALAKFAINHEDIKAEFEDVPQVSAKTSELPEGCDTKNRYANVIPLPESRVILNPIEGYPNSDYINANYVTGPNNIKGYYIATQGPMQNTVDDFWRMIWEQQAKVILMLTHLVENGLEKCVDYLPESEVIECSTLFGDFQITLKKREVKEKYIISSLQLKNMVSNSWREVTHFWYLGWPEKGVPAEANSLIAFLIEARSYMKTVTIDKKNGINMIHNGANSQTEHNPVVVHCSPGTGRTGVAIACDIAIREFETTRLVDIPKIVYRIRRDRANAIQTKEQYIFIYKVVSLYATKLTGGALESL